MKSIEKTSRNENLQILRFIAAALVLATHISFYMHERINSDIDIWHAGEIGVPIFFTISGFVMYLSGTKLPRNIEGARLFLSRRVARVFPLYWVITTLKVLVAIIAPAAILHNKPDLLNTLGSYVLFPMFNKDGGISPIHGVAWTLLHEMFFYYVFSLALFLQKPPFLFSSVAIISLWIIGLVFQPDYAFVKIMSSEINLLFVVGMGLAYCYKRGFHFSQSTATLILLIAIGIRIIPSVAEIKLSLLGGFNIEAILIVAALLSMKFSTFTKARNLLIKLGDSSYSLYLVHPILAPAICVSLLKLSITSVFLIFPISFLASIAISHLIFLRVENPLNTLAGRVLERPLKIQTI